MAVFDEVLQRYETTSRVSKDVAGAEQKNEERLLQTELEAMKRTLLLKYETTHDPRWLVALCHVVNQFVTRLVVAAPPSTAEPACFDKCVFLLENAIMTSLHSLKWMSQHTTTRDDDDNAMEIDAGARSERPLTQHRDFKSLLQHSYRRLFDCVLVSFRDDERGNRSRSVAAAILSRLGLLLAICWLSVDRNTLLANTMELLAIAAECCEQHRDARLSAKWPLFLLGLLHLVEKCEREQALQYFQTATMLLQDSNIRSDQDGAIHYWYGVALFKNGHFVQATDQLQRCLRYNYAPVASLNLSVLAHLRGNRDFHASSLELQRALEIDFLESVTMFNYAALLGAMRNFAAQQQMLEYYQEAMHPEGSVAVERKRARSGTPRAKRDNATRTDGASSTAAVELFAEAQLAELFAPNVSLVTSAMLSCQLAYAAMENGDWEQSKQYFEELLAVESSEMAETRTEVYRDYIYVLLQCNLHSLALETCDRVLASTQDDSSNRVSEALLLTHIYKADALLSLERVLECHHYLKQTVKPLIHKLLPPQHQRFSTKMAPAASESPSEAAACHIQLINNLAVVTACQDDDNAVDAAVAMLRDGVHLYPQALSLKFNLVLLLWRKQQKESACSIWFEARGWSLHMDTRDISDDQKAVEMVVNAEEAAILAAANSHSQIAQHVRSRDSRSDDEETDNGGVARQQLLYLDALVLNHWGKIQSSREIEMSVNYIQYLDSLTSSISLVSVNLAASYEQYRYRLPNGLGVPNARAVGHNGADGGGGTNVFGRDFIILGDGDWNVALCQKDSDGDGQTNGQELGDPCCAWSQADYPRPHRTMGISHPGDATVTANPALWKDLNCTEYRILVRRLTSAAAPKPSQFASLLMVTVVAAVQAIFLL